MSDFKPNPLTQLFPIAIGGFGWQVHGLWIGVGLALAFVGFAIASNMLTIARMPDSEDAGADGCDWARKIQRRKWILFAVFMIGIALSGYETISV
jgi:hypothetical protein